MAKISTQAQIALWSLRPEDRVAVQMAIGKIDRWAKNLRAEELVRSQAVRLAPPLEDTYMLRVSRDLRVVFKLENHEAEIVDIATRLRLSKMRAAAKQRA